MNWLNLGYGALGLAAIIVGASVPAVAFLVPVGAGIMGHSLPSLGSTVSTVVSLMQKNEEKKTNG